MTDYTNDISIYINARRVLIYRKLAHLKQGGMDLYAEASQPFNLEDSDPLLVLLGGLQTALNTLDKHKITGARLRVRVPSGKIVEALRSEGCPDHELEGLWKRFHQMIRNAGHTVEAIEVDQTKADMMTEGFMPPENYETPERWKPCSRAPDRYEVSNLGRVRSLCKNGRKAKEGILKPYPAAGGYLHVDIYVDKGARRQAVAVHLLVLESHIGPRPEGCWAAHWNDDPTDNRLDNLRWDTPKSNVNDRQFTRPKGYTVDRLEPHQQVLYWDCWTEKFRTISG